jgi:hypothetical protein
MSKTGQTMKQQDTKPTQPSEQIKLALSVDKEGRMILQSIAGRPPSVASTERQGLHTVAWAAYEATVVDAINGHKPATAFANIIALSDSLLGQTLTSSLINEQQSIDVEAFKKWQDDFEAIGKNKTLDPEIKKYALKGKLTEIFPIMEKAIKAILSNQNMKQGVAYSAIGNIASNKDEGAKIKAAIEELSKLETDLIKASREAKQKPIIQKVAEETSGLFHYPYVSQQNQIDENQKKQLIADKEYRSLASFRDNDVNLLAVQLSNLLGALYEKNPSLKGNSGNKTYPQINEAVVNKIVEGGGWQEAVKDWYKQETGKQNTKDAVLFLTKRVNDILHTDPKNIGLFEDVDSEAELTNSATSSSSKTFKSDDGTETGSKSRSQSGGSNESSNYSESEEVEEEESKEIEIDKGVVIGKLQEQIEFYQKSKEVKISLTRLTKDLGELQQSCVEKQQEQDNQKSKGK